MKQNKEQIHKLFYEFLVKEGVLFEALSCLGAYKSLEEMCMNVHPLAYLWYIHSWMPEQTEQNRFKWNVLLNSSWLKTYKYRKSNGTNCGQ